MSHQPDKDYNSEFFGSFEESSKRSAEALIPHLLSVYPAESVADFGCGLGIWLASWKEAGVRDVYGFDGDYVDRSKLRIPEEQFSPMDLRKPAAPSVRTDLATCLEVAEHLPADTAPAIVKTLTQTAPVVLFSAAVPGQPGVGHINPQWPEYWIRLFAEEGFVALDFLREKIWHNEDISLHYRQNVLLFVNEKALADFDKTKSLRELPKANCLILVDQDVLKELFGLKSTVRRLLHLVRARLAGRKD